MTTKETYYLIVQNFTVKRFFFYEIDIITNLIYTLIFFELTLFRF